MISGGEFFGSVSLKCDPQQKSAADPAGISGKNFFGVRVGGVIESVDRIPYFADGVIGITVQTVDDLTDCGNTYPCQFGNVTDIGSFCHLHSISGKSTIVMYTIKHVWQLITIYPAFADMSRAEK